MFTQYIILVFSYEESQWQQAGFHRKFSQAQEHKLSLINYGVVADDIRIERRSPE